MLMNRIATLLIFSALLAGCVGGKEPTTLHDSSEEVHPLSASTFTWNPIFPFVGDRVQFEPSVRSSIPEDTIQRLTWTMDGATYTENRPSHTFMAPGTHTIHLIIDSEQGGRYKLNDTIDVAIRGNDEDGDTPPGPSNQNATSPAANVTDSPQNETAAPPTLLEQAILQGPSFSCGSNEPHKDIMPSLDWHCIGTEPFVVDGRSLGFTDNQDIFGVRPGMNIGGCSTSFMLTDNTGALYLTQSAHCVFDNEGESFCDSTFAAIGSSHTIEGFSAPASLVYVSGAHMQAVGGSTVEECDTYDVAILRIPESLRNQAHPAIRHIGGPTSLTDVLDLQVDDPMVGYGNSDDRGLVIEFATGQDHGTLPVWPTLNVFNGYYVGGVLNEVYCPLPALTCREDAGVHGMHHYVRYTHPKITGDSGSADLTAAGGAFGVTSVINLATALTGTVPIYDALLKIAIETGHVYQVVTWDEWSPETLET